MILLLANFEAGDDVSLFKCMMGRSKSSARALRQMYLRPIIELSPNLRKLIAAAVRIQPVAQCRKGIKITVTVVESGERNSERRR
jgi:hypothetical protein